MPKPRVDMIASSTMRYGRAKLRAGESFTCTEPEAVLFEAIRAATRATVIAPGRGVPQIGEPLTVRVEAPSLETREAPPVELADPTALSEALADELGPALNEDPLEPVDELAGLDLEQLRALYQQTTGSEADKRWGAPRLRASINAAVALRD